MKFININDTDIVIEYILESLQIDKDNKNLTKENITKQDIEEYFNEFNFTNSIYYTGNGPIPFYINTSGEEPVMFYIPNGSAGDFNKLVSIIENTNNNPITICKPLSNEDYLESDIITRAHFYFNNIYYKII